MLLFGLMSQDDGNVRFVLGASLIDFVLLDEPIVLDVAFGITIDEKNLDRRKQSCIETGGSGGGME